MTVVYEQNASLAEVRNRAAKQVSGDWIIFLDADDELAPGYVDAMRTSLNGDISAMYVPRVSYIFGKRVQKPKYWPEINLALGNWLVIGTMVPRHLLLAVGGFTEGVDLYEDWMVFAQLWKAGARLIKVPNAVYCAHVMPESRNRSVRPLSERLYWHQWIGHAVFPEKYQSTTVEEDKIKRLLERRRDARRLRFMQ